MIDYPCGCKFFRKRVRAGKLLPCSPRLCPQGRSLRMRMSTWAWLLRKRRPTETEMRESDRDRQAYTAHFAAQCKFGPRA